MPTERFVIILFLGGLFQSNVSFGSLTDMLDVIMIKLFIQFFCVCYRRNRTAFGTVINIRMKLLQYNSNTNELMTVTVDMAELMFKIELEIVFIYYSPELVMVRTVYKIRKLIFTQRCHSNLCLY